MQTRLQHGKTQWQLLLCVVFPKTGLVYAKQPSSCDGDAVPTRGRPMTASCSSGSTSALSYGLLQATLRSSLSLRSPRTFWRTWVTSVNKIACMLRPCNHTFQPSTSFTQISDTPSLQLVPLFILRVAVLAS